MNKSLVTLIILAFFLFAAGIYAGWREDMKRGGIDTTGNKVTTIKPTKVGSSGTSISQLQCLSAVFKDSSTTTQTYTLSGLTTADQLYVMPASACGTAYVRRVAIATGRYSIEWSADPGTTVTQQVLWFKLH